VSLFTKSGLRYRITTRFRHRLPRHLAWLSAEIDGTVKILPTAQMLDEHYANFKPAEVVVSHWLMASATVLQNTFCNLIDRNIDTGTPETYTSPHTSFGNTSQTGVS
jgi:hypothetical protein